MKNPFDECFEEYDRYRPGYPPELIDYVIDACRLDETTLALDVGAGTGKASAPLISRGIPAISLESSLAMARQGQKSYPNLRYVCATAEALPFKAGIFRYINSGQAFHWFDPVTALPEFARVLEPRGRLALYWNSRDSRKECVRDFADLVRLFNPQAKLGYRAKDWGEVINGSGVFRLIEHREFSQIIPMTMEDWIGLSRSISYVRSISDEKLKKFERALEKRFSIYSGLDCPYVTNTWLAEKVDDVRN
jgi:SAM-dependent methyltransferase